MKVLLINGSPRVNGNTNLALERCAKALNDNGIETEIFQIGNKPVRGCLGCDACTRNGSCVFNDDVLNEMVEKMKEADGYVIGSPVYYAGPNGALCALLDRAFYSASKYFKYKPAAAVAVCRRSGGTVTIDRLNKYFTINQMPVVSSVYWNILHGSEAGEVLQDEEGLQTVEILGNNMAGLLKELEGKQMPQFNGKRVHTNFIR